ncbi:collagenase 3-like isoform X2 [Armigeres subalbatus]|uniref:collagenase 3-like isoform X2 n=1 Tax=Armigeres subalbatus TaxID=124917 RepID=UPI002ED1B58B
MCEPYNASDSVIQLIGCRTQFRMVPRGTNLLGAWCLPLVIICSSGAPIGLDEAIEIFSKTLTTMETDSQSPVVPIEVPDLTEDDAEILDQLGFNSSAEMMQHEYLSDIKSKIMQYQRLYGLPATGELCRETKISLRRPRCGVSDVAAYGEDYKWTKNLLTYYVRNFPAGVSIDSVKNLLRTAFDQWSAVTNLDFNETENMNADIEIVFGSRHHPHRWQYCGSELGDTTLAHAFFPQIGAIHFNTKFYFGTQNEDDFFNTAMHEIGHVLGLEHSVNPASIMYPSLVARFSEIPLIDVEKIQFKYGRRERGESTPSPAFCSLDKFDAVLNDRNKELYFISGKYYFTRNSAHTPVLLSEKWPGVPDHLDAAITIASLTYMFRGEEVWAFENNKLELGYPRKIRHTFPGIPKNLDAISRYREKYLFAFKNEHYWRYNMEKRIVDHSGELTEFGVPSRVDAAAFNETQNAIIFFKSNTRYVYDCDTLQTTTDYSRPLGC